MQRYTFFLILSLCGIKFLFNYKEINILRNGNFLIMSVYVYDLLQFQTQNCHFRPEQINYSPLCFTLFAISLRTLSKATGFLHALLHSVRNLFENAIESHWLSSCSLSCGTLSKCPNGTSSPQVLKPRTSSDVWGHVTAGGTRPDRTL